MKWKLVPCACCLQQLHSQPGQSRPACHLTGATCRRIRQSNMHTHTHTHKHTHTSSQALAGCVRSFVTHSNWRGPGSAPYARAWALLLQSSCNIGHWSQAVLRKHRRAKLTCQLSIFNAGIGSILDLWPSKNSVLNCYNCQSYFIFSDTTTYASCHFNRISCHVPTHWHTAQQLSSYLPLLIYCSSPFKFLSQKCNILYSKNKKMFKKFVLNVKVEIFWCIT